MFVGFMVSNMGCARYRFQHCCAMIGRFEHLKFLSFCYQIRRVLGLAFHPLLLKMSFCIGYGSNACPLEAVLGQCKTQCRHCRWASWNADAYEIPKHLHLCPGEKNQGCPQEAWISTRNSHCKGCGQQEQKRVLWEYLQGQPSLAKPARCACENCPQCDRDTWSSWLDASNDTSLTNVFCSRPVAGPKKHKAQCLSGLCAFCIIKK